MNEINIKQVGKTVGQAIARERQSCKLTQEEVAERLGIGMEAVSRMERGLVVPTVVRLAELAQIFECELADLLRASSSRPLDQGIMLAQQLERLSVGDRTLLLETMQLLIARLAKD